MSLHSGLLWLADGFDKYENLPKPRVDHYKSYVVSGAGDHACADKVSPKLIINADQRSAKSQPQQVKPSQRPNSARPPKQSSAVNTTSSKKRPRSYRRCTKVTAPGDPTPRTGAWTSDTLSPRANHGPPGTNRHYCDLPTHPDLRYFDRHSRCYNNPHCGDYLTSDRPRTACSAGRVSLDQCECCGEITSMIRYRYAPSGSAMTGMNAKNKTFLYPEKLLHYDSYNGRRRPSSAPPRACHRRPPHHNYVVRGDIPHFCNFVRPCSIYDKVTKQKILEDDDLNEFILRYRAGDGDPLQLPSLDLQLSTPKYRNKNLRHPSKPVSRVYAIPKPMRYTKLNRKRHTTLLPAVDRPIPTITVERPSMAPDILQLDEESYHDDAVKSFPELQQDLVDDLNNDFQQILRQIALNLYEEQTSPLTSRRASHPPVGSISTSDPHKLPQTLELQWKDLKVKRKSLPSDGRQITNGTRRSTKASGFELPSLSDISKSSPILSLRKNTFPLIARDAQAAAPGRGMTAEGKHMAERNKGDKLVSLSDPSATHRRERHDVEPLTSYSMDSRLADIGSQSTGRRTVKRTSAAGSSASEDLLGKVELNSLPDIVAGAPLDEVAPPGPTTRHVELPQLVPPNKLKQVRWHEAVYSTESFSDLLHEHDDGNKPDQMRDVVDMLKETTDLADKPDDVMNRLKETESLAKKSDEMSVGVEHSTDVLVTSDSKAVRSSTSMFDVGQEMTKHSSPVHQYHEHVRSSFVSSNLMDHRPSDTRVPSIASAIVTFTDGVVWTSATALEQHAPHRLRSVSGRHGSSDMTERISNQSMGERSLTQTQTSSHLLSSYSHLGHSPDFSRRDVHTRAGSLSQDRKFNTDSVCTASDKSLTTCSDEKSQNVAESDAFGGMQPLRSATGMSGSVVSQTLNGEPDSTGGSVERVVSTPSLEKFAFGEARSDHSESAELSFGKGVTTSSPSLFRPGDSFDGTPVYSNISLQANRDAPFSSLTNYNAASVSSLANYSTHVSSLVNLNTPSVSSLANHETHISAITNQNVPPDRRPQIFLPSPSISPHHLLDLRSPSTISGLVPSGQMHPFTAVKADSVTSHLTDNNNDEIDITYKENKRNIHLPTNYGQQKEKASSEASLRRESSLASKNPLSKITVELFNELKEELFDPDKKGQAPQQPAPELSSEPGADNSILLSPRHHGSAAEISRVSSPQNSLHVPSEAQLNDVITNIQSERLSTVSIRSNKSKKQMSHHRKRPATSSSKLEKKSADTDKVMASSDKRKGLFEDSNSSVVIAEPVESPAPVEVPKETAPTTVVVPSETLIADVPADDVPQQPESEAKLSTLPVKPKYTRRVASGGHDEEPWTDLDQTARLNAFMRQHRGSKLKLRRDSLLMSAQVRSPLKMQAWMNGRLALSKRSSRFELPMDMRVLETMTPLDYLAKYCVVTSRRQMLYDKIYGKHRNSSTGKLGFQELQKALSDVLIQSIDDKMMKLVIQMLLLDDQVQIDKKLFHGISAFSERLLYPIFARGEQYKTETQKEKIETADFFALEWKFHGVNVNDPMRKILETL